MMDPRTRSRTERLRHLVRASPLGPAARAARECTDVARWTLTGHPPPAPHPVKRAMVRRYARRHGCRVLVESGTFEGDMVEGVRRSFDRVISIELDEDLARRARARFAEHPSVAIVQGDSGQILRDVLAGIDRPCVLWLDGHYSAGVTARGSSDTPIALELAHVGAHPLRGRHVVLIDDARLFTGAGDYPTLEWVEAWARSAGYPGAEVVDDVIVIAPPP